jgi:hypothetical protein
LATWIAWLTTISISVSVDSLGVVLLFADWLVVLLRVVQVIVKELLLNVPGNLLPVVLGLSKRTSGPFSQHDTLQVFDVAIDYAEVGLQLGNPVVEPLQGIGGWYFYYRIVQL